MRKEFTFKNYFKYVLRYWLVAAICAVVGLAGGILFSIFNQTGQKYSYQGNICIKGVSTLSDVSENFEELYSGIKSDALDAMRSETVLNSVYGALENEWLLLPGNGKLSTGKAREAFGEQISVTASGPFLYVKFTVSSKKHIDEFRAFGEKAVTTYLAQAKIVAENREPLLKSKDMLDVNPAIEQIPQEIEGIGLLKGGAIGVLGGVAVALIALIIAFFADKRVLSYGDIAYFTGNRLISVNKGRACNNVCPSIDAAMSGASVLAVCGDEQGGGSLARLYGEYSSGSGRKTLIVDFSRGGDDRFERFVKGEPINNCVTANGCGDVMSGGRSWTLLPCAKQKTDELKKIYAKIIVCAPFTGDGSLSVISEFADKTVFVINQSKHNVNWVMRMAQECAAPDKVIGAVIDGAGKSFVGGDTYIAEPIAEEE